MARHCFQRTNCLECVFDGNSKDIRVAGRLTHRAVTVARVVTHGVNDRGDWSDWHVSRLNLKGYRVLVQPFVPRANRLARAA